MAVTAWVQGEHSVLRLGFPLWGSRTFPLNSLLSPNLPELQMFVSAQTRKAQLVVVLGHSSVCTFQAEILLITIKG